MRDGRSRRSALVAALVLVLVGSTGCGSSSYRYVKSSEHATYFKVPAGWQELDRDQLRAMLLRGEEAPQGSALSDRLRWQVAYDADPRPTLDHVLAVDSPTRPAVFAQVLRLLPQEQRQINLDRLRDLFLPVTQLQGQQAAADQADPKSALTRSDVELVSDEVVAHRGLRGVHLVFNLRTGAGAPLQTFDQTALLSADGTTVHWLVVRCSTACYTQERDAIAEIVQSFTVRESRRG